jgi:CHAD domain-containing protein
MRRPRTGRVGRVSGASPVDAETSAGPALGRRAPAADQLRVFVAAQLEELRRNGPTVRTSENADALHDMRVAVRRLRAVLRTARPMLDRAWVDQLRDELDVFGQLLGAVRDLDVLIERLGQEGWELGAGGDLERLLAPFELERDRARSELRAAMDGPSYYLILDRLDSAARFMPVLPRDLTVERLAGKEFKKLRKLKKRASLDDDRQLHELRIRGKRARYAAELAESSRGSAATKFIKATKKLQDTLGDHQDAVVALRELRRSSGPADSRTAFLAGRLAERQEQRKGRARQEFTVSWKRVKKAGRAAW